MAKTSSVPTDPLRAACEDMEERVSAAAARMRRANNSLIDASLALAREKRRLTPPRLTPLKAITDEPDEADIAADLTAKYTALREPV